MIYIRTSQCLHNLHKNEKQTKKQPTKQTKTCRVTLSLSIFFIRLQPNLPVESQFEFSQNPLSVWPAVRR